MDTTHVLLMTSTAFTYSEAGIPFHCVCKDGIMGGRSAITPPVTLASDYPIQEQSTSSVTDKDISVVLMWGTTKIHRAYRELDRHMHATPRS
jgi:hypothetical protein